MAGIKRNLAYNFLLSCSQLLLPLLSIPYVSRVLDPSGIGQVGFIDSFTYYFVIIAELGITTYGIREVAKCQNDPVRLNILVPQLLTLHIISSLVTLVFYVICIVVLWQRIGDPRLVLFSLSFFLVNFFACEWYFMGREQFGFIALRSITVRLLGLASIFLLVKETADYYLYYAVIVGAAMLTCIWNNIAMFREIHFSFRKVAWQQHLRYVWVTYLISLFYSVPLVLDNVLVGLVSTAAVVGIYSFSVKMVRIGSTILTDSFLVFFPRIVSLSSEMKYEQLLQKLTLNSQFIILLAVPMGMGLYLVADELAAVFFGGKFMATTINLKVLALFPLVKGVSLFLSNPVLIAQHHEKAVLKNLVIYSVVFVLSATWLTSMYQSLGACIALLLTEITLLLLNLVSVRRYFPLVKMKPLVFVHAITGSLLFIPLALYLRPVFPAGPIGLGLIIVCCILVYLLALIVMKNELVMRVRRIVRGETAFQSTGI
ncbi:MAG: hypothetical protein EOO05_11085 [Chitinophagaceae bacterium]|nr:MAG: hypothetical protein EOO05_11085 [Chitinophagaceae bacterium]